MSKRSDRRPSGDDVRNVQSLREKRTEWVQQAGQDGTTSVLQSRTVTVYAYMERIWREGRSLRASGDSQSGVHWPPGKPAAHEREWRREETYRAVFSAASDGKHNKQDAGNEHTAKLDERTWQTLEIGKPYHLQLSIFGSIHAVKPV